MKNPNTKKRLARRRNAERRIWRLMAEAVGGPEAYADAQHAFSPANKKLQYQVRHASRRRRWDARHRQYLLNRPIIIDEFAPWPPINIEALDAMKAHTQSMIEDVCGLIVIPLRERHHHPDPTSGKANP